MSKNLYSDFAVLTAAGRTVNFAEVAESLRIIPFADEVSLADAMQGRLWDYSSDSSGGSFVQKDATGLDVTNVTIQHPSDGYTRLVGKLVKPENADFTIAKGFAIVSLEDRDASSGSYYVSAESLKVYAVASFKEGYNLGESNHVAFTITTLNNYKSVSFNPNAFATLEDIADINGLDGLHIAFDTTSGDIKLLDKDGNVLDQANLHMDADTIIADGEEGYKYVKTDIDQDIHSVKAFMPEGTTAFDDVAAEEYVPKNAALLVDLSDLNEQLASAENELPNAEAALRDEQAIVESLQEELERNPDSEEAPDMLADAQERLADAERRFKEFQDEIAGVKAEIAEALQAARHGDYSNVRGIRVGRTDYQIGGAYNNSKVGASAVPFLEKCMDSELEYCLPVYSPDAFVWTVGKDVGPSEGPDNFAQEMNLNAQALGFHVGDDIPLGTNLPALIDEMGSEDMGQDFDVEAYMHGGEDGDYTDLVDKQRNLAKDELVAWNAQHPALKHDGLNGTRISEDGVDIRNGVLSIGNGFSAERQDFPKHYNISTNYSLENGDKGLNIGVVDEANGAEHNIVMINRNDYISGAPICMVLAQIHINQDEDGNSVPSVIVQRKTANFSVSVPESLAEGTFALTINDQRPNAAKDVGEFGAKRIIEIIPVYTPGADTSEAVPALQPIHAMGDFRDGDNWDGDNDAYLDSITVQCSQVLDWAASLGLGEKTVGDPSAELYLIIKVY